MLPFFALGKETPQFLPFSNILELTIYETPALDLLGVDTPSSSPV